jgi:hypothetical protein
MSTKAEARERHTGFRIKAVDSGKKGVFQRRLEVIDHQSNSNFHDKMSNLFLTGSEHKSTQGRKLIICGVGKGRCSTQD